MLGGAGRVPLHGQVGSLGGSADDDLGIDQVIDRGAVFGLDVAAGCLEVLHAGDGGAEGDLLGGAAGEGGEGGTEARTQAGAIGSDSRAS